MSLFLSHAPVLDGFVVYDRDGHIYQSDLNRIGNGMIPKTYNIEKAVQLFHELSFVHGIQCKIGKISIYHGFTLDPYVQITKANGILTRNGLLLIDIDDLILQTLVNNDAIEYVFFEETMKKGFGYMLNVAGRATIFKKHLSNLGIDTDDLLFFKSWVSGPEKLINTLYLMEKKSKKIHNVQEINDLFNEIKKSLIQDFVDGSSDMNECIPEQEKRWFNHKFSSGDYFVVYDQDKNVYNNNLKPLMRMKKMSFKTALEIYMKLYKNNKKAYKFGCMQKVTISQLSPVDNSDISNDRHDHEKEIYRLGLKTILSHFGITPRIYNKTVSQNFTKILTLKSDSLYYWLEDKIEETADKLKCKNLFFERGNMCGPDYAMDHVYDKHKNICQIHNISDIKEDVKNLSTTLMNMFD